MFTSFAQNFEDVLLRRAFRPELERGEPGFYVDVGAFDPTEDSVTRTFYDAGWNGLNLEPGPSFERFPAARPRDVNLPLAVGDAAGRATFRVHRAGERVLGTSSLLRQALPSLPDGEAHEELREVQVATLAQLLALHAEGRTIHFLKVDVEGAEAAVLRGNDWTRFRPEIVLAEAVRPVTLERTDGEWRAILLDAGYREVWFDGLNSWFLRRESENRAAAFGTPPNIFDAFRRHDPAAEQAQALRDELAAAATREAALRSEAAALEARNRAVQEWGSGLDAALAAARAELAAAPGLRDAVERLGAEKAALLARLAALEGEHRAARDWGGSLETALAAARAELEKTQERLAEEAAVSALLARDLAEERDHGAALRKASLEAETRILHTTIWDLQQQEQALTRLCAEQEEELQALRLQHHHFVHGLRMPDGPVALRLVLPLARAVRRGAALAGRGTPHGPDPVPRTLPVGAPALIPPVPPPAPAAEAAGEPEMTPALASSVEAALLTLALREGAARRPA